MNDKTELKLRVWEQHGQTIVAGLTLMALAWAADSLSEAKIAQAQAATEIRALTATVSKLEMSLSNMQALSVTRAEFLVHEQRIQSLEARK